MKIFLWLTVLILLVFSNVLGQEKIEKIGIVNGKATKLPIPDYPQEAKDFCANGKVEIEVLIGEDGSVLEAKAISGDELLHAPSVEAAKKAKFAQTLDVLPVKIKGIVVYNFDSRTKCSEIKVPANKKALSIPRPQVAHIIHPKHLRLKQEQIVEVQIIVEVSTGKVIRARAVSGHPMLRAACEISARQAIFSPLNDVPPDVIPAKAILVYKFNPNGKIVF